jgi:hypothetical protein
MNQCFVNNGEILQKMSGGNLGVILEVDIERIDVYRMSHI